MFSIGQRLRIWMKLAQQAPAGTTTTPAPATQQANIPPPPAFQASAAYGWMTRAYNAYTVTTLNNLIATLNVALHYSSNGKYNFLILRNNSFQVDPSAAPSVDTKNLLNLAILIYKTYLNSGNPLPQQATPQQIQTWNQRISTSQALLNLSQLSPTGQIAQRIPGNLRENILNFLRYLSMYNPIQQRR